MGIALTKQKHVIFDVETTGLSALRGDRIIEIGALAVENEDIIGEFHTLIDVGMQIPCAVRRIHGITNDMLIGKPRPEEVFPQFRDFIKNSILVAHNAQFDMRFLRYEFARQGFGLGNKYLCTLEMCRKRFPQLPDYKLETVCRHLFGRQVEEVQMHRALEDARMVARVWMKIMK